MNIKEMIANAKKSLAALKERIEAGEDEAIEQGEKLMAEIAELEAKAAKAAKASAILGAIGDGKPVDQPVETPAKSIGDAVAKSVVGKAEKGSRFSIVSGSKAATDPQTIPQAVKPAITDYDRNVVGIRLPHALANLFGSETISGNALTYFVEGTVEGAVAGVDENGHKPQIHFSDPTPKTVSLTKLAAFYKESDEIIEDAAWLASSIDNRALYLMDVKEESQLLTWLLNTNGLGVREYAATGLTVMDIKRAKTQVKKTTGFTPDAVVMSPEDYDNLIASSLNTNWFVNPWSAEEPRLWGMTVYQSADITAGTIVVGCFKQGASVIQKGGRSVEVTNSNDTDFEYNRVTVRIEERIALAVRYPAAFVVLTQATE